ncbi:MAG TPA: WD40 repeat domain-containing protein [Polyangia bacterium]|jgi:WD40 repeat protein|nr:WD40 repeat domain-containing protein [Polyangia bacterium]
MKWTLVAGGAVGAALILVGCGGSVGSSPQDAGTGIVLSQPPPFAIGQAPAPTTFEVCDTLSQPEPVGFLADGRAVIGQTVRAADYSKVTLVRAWDPRTNAVERLFVGSPHYSGTLADILKISSDGRRIVDTAYGQLRVYDLDRRALVTDQAMPAGVIAVAAGGEFVLGADLRRYTAAGEMDFDFMPFVPSDVRYDDLDAFPGALSVAGDAAAVNTVDSVSGAAFVLVLYQDGRVVRLYGPPPDDCGGGGCGKAWSADGRNLLDFGAGALTVWDVESASSLAHIDAGVSAAAFSSDGTRVITADANGQMTERDLSGNALSTWAVAGDPRTAFGPGRVLGHDPSGLVVATGDRVEARWRQPGYSWPGAVAVTSAGVSYAITFDWDAPTSSMFPLMLARFDAGFAGPTAVFQPRESQSEWVGQVELSPDEQRVAAVFPDAIWIFDAATLSPLASIRVGAGMITWSPDGRYLATTPDFHYRDFGRRDYLPTPEVAVWNTSSGTLAARFQAPVYPKAIAYDAGGRTLVGWGLPTLTDMPHEAIAPQTGLLHSYTLGGDAAGFAIDLATSTASAKDLPPFVAATRDLIATERSIVSVSSGAALSTITAPISSGVFSPDFSVLLAVDQAPESVEMNVRLLGVATGDVIASIPTTVGPYPQPALAVSRGGRVVGVAGDFFCAR